MARKYVAGGSLKEKYKEFESPGSGDWGGGGGGYGLWVVDCG